MSLISLRFFLLKEEEPRLLHTVENGSLVDEIEVSSTYNTAMHKNVYSTANGVITELAVTNGSIVSQGDDLFHIESTATEEEIASAYAAYMKSLNSLNISKQDKVTLQASLEKERQKVLDAQIVVDSLDYNDLSQEEKDSKQSALTSSRQSFTAIEKQYLEADQGIGSANADYQAKKLAYNATQSITITAPASGKVVNLLKVTGDEVSTNQTDKPILIIANLGNPSITVSVNEIYAPKLDVKQQATIVFDAYKNTPFKGIVESVETIGSEDAGVISYAARISILDITPEIKPKMTAIVTIETLRKDNILTIPNSAIFREKENTYVYVLRGPRKKEEKVMIKIGIQGTIMSEVLSGLNADDIILANVD